MAKNNRRIARERRHARVRTKVVGKQASPRLCVFRSLNHIYAQVIDDAQQHTIAQASTLDPEIKTDSQGRTKISASELVGSLIANRAREKGIVQVVFDRGGYRYHEAGLQF